MGTLSTPNRLDPRYGDIPFARVLGNVLDAGYQGMFDLELIGPKIEEEELHDAYGAAPSTTSAASSSRCGA